MFSPIGSNLSASTSSQSHRPSGVTHTNNNALDSPRTLGVTTAAGTTPSALKNVRSSATRSLTELGSATDRSHDSMPKSYSDTRLITNTRPSSEANLGGSLIPSATKHHSTAEHSSENSRGIDVNGDSRQPLSSLSTEAEGTISAQGIHVSYYLELTLIRQQVVCSMNLFP